MKHGKEYELGPARNDQRFLLHAEHLFIDSWHTRTLHHISISQFSSPLPCLDGVGDNRAGSSPAGRDFIRFVKSGDATFNQNYRHIMT